MSVVEDFREALARNSAAAHGPLSPQEALAATCERVAALAGDRAVAVPSADPLLDGLGVVPALRDAGLTLVGPDHPDWRDAVADCAVGVTGSLAAAAETGTVAIECGPGAPRAVSLVPDAHVCLVAAESVEERLEEAFSRAVAGGLPPALLWISGPSRTADIEKRIVLGMHGPRTFEAVIVDL